MTRQEYLACPKFARRLARHLVMSRDALNGSGMFRSPRKLKTELGVSESTVRRGLRELVEAGVFEKERRTDPRGTGRRHTTSAYRAHHALNIQPGYVATSSPLRCVTNDRPIDTPIDTPRSSKLHVEALPTGARLEAAMSSGDVAEETGLAPAAAWASPSSANTGVHTGQGVTTPRLSVCSPVEPTHTQHISPSRNQESRGAPAAAAVQQIAEWQASREKHARELDADRGWWRKAFRAAHGREPTEDDDRYESRFEYQREASRLRRLVAGELEVE